MKVQFRSNYNTPQYNTKKMPAFKGAKSNLIEMPKFIIESKNPLISDEVRELARWFNDFYIGIEKQVNAFGYHSFRDTHIIDGEEIELDMDKNPYPTQQIGKIEFSKRSSAYPNANVIETITYYPRQNANGECGDHIYESTLHYGSVEIGLVKEEGTPESDERTPAISEIFAMYARVFKEKLEPFKNSYQFNGYPAPLWRRTTS